MKTLLSNSIGLGSNNQKIFRAAAIVGFSTLLVKAIATLKELIVARWFGRNDALDAFLIAFLVPSFIVNLAMGALGSALVPVFVETLKKQGREAAQQLFSGVLFLSTISLALLAILSGLLAPMYLPYLASNFSAEKLRLTFELLGVLLPLFVFSGISVFVSVILNVGENFKLPALVIGITPAITILFLELLAGKWDVFALAAGTATGSILETLVLVRALRRQKMRFSFRWSGWEPPIREVLRHYLPMLGGSFLMGGTLVVDQSMAAMLPGGSVAALGYGNKVVALIVAIGATALSTAALPYFSQMVVHQDWDGCRHTLKRYSFLVLSIVVPATLCLILLSKPLVGVLFQRGAFRPSDTELVSRVQICYSIQIPFYVLGMMFVRFLSAAKRNDVLMYGAAISLVLDIVLNLILMRVWGVVGIALSTSLVYVASFAYLVSWSSIVLSRQRSSAVISAQAQEVIR